MTRAARLEGRHWNASSLGRLLRERLLLAGVAFGVANLGGDLARVAVRVKSIGVHCDFALGSLLATVPSKDVFVVSAKGVVIVNVSSSSRRHALVLVMRQE